MLGSRCRSVEETGPVPVGLRECVGGLAATPAGLRGSFKSQPRQAEGQVKSLNYNIGVRIVAIRPILFCHIFSRSPSPFSCPIVQRTELSDSVWLTWLKFRVDRVH